MRSISICIALVAILLAAGFAGAGQVDRNPALQSIERVPDNWAGLLAPWDLLFSFEVATVTGAAGNTGAEYDGTYYYSGRWASDLLFQFDKDGRLLKEFVVPGVANMRDFAYNPNNGLLYGGAAGGTIWGIDPINEVLVETINGNFQCRAIAYNHKDDFFYVSNWADPVWMVDHGGNILGTFNLVTTTSTYGFAYENSCMPYPVLWVFDQGGGSVIHEYNLDAMAYTGFTYDVGNEFPGTIAGALAVTDEHWWWPDTWVIMGLAQTDPDPFFVYELCEKDAFQWDVCMKDVNYTPEIWVSLAGGGVFHGQAILEGNPSFPAPVTGYLQPGPGGLKIYFTIAYLNSGGVRFYEIDFGNNRDGTTWGIINETGKFYDTQHYAHLDPCGPGEATESGAAVH
jgi:hypothetical protein